VADRSEITGGGFEARMETDALFCADEFGLRVVEVTPAELGMDVPSGVAHTTMLVTVN